MKATPSEIEKYLGIIAETPLRIGQAAKGLDEHACNSNLRANPGQ